MKKNIPFDYFYEYYVMLFDHQKRGCLPDFWEKQEKWKNNMLKVSWQDLVKLTPDEMIKVPYDWVGDCFFYARGKNPPKPIEINFQSTH